MVGDPIQSLRAAISSLAGAANAPLASREAVERLLDTYVLAKRSLANDVARLVRDELVEGSTLLEESTDAVGRRMAELFGGRIDDRYVRVKKYRGVHPLLLDYLALNVGKDVPASRLRAITGDQVHTERRVRELRDLGFNVTWRRVGPEDHYSLSSTDPDLDTAARFQLDHRIKEDGSISATKKMLFLLQAEVGRPVKTARLKWLSGGQSQYDRRIRELRERFEISSGLNRSDLAQDEYLLESIEEKPPHDHFRPAVRDAALRRDSFSCQDCGWNRDDAHRQGRRYLEVHHLQHRAAGGPSDLDNAVTLCNVCHDARHRGGETN